MAHNRHRYLAIPLLAVGLLLASACASTGVHPGAANVFDSQTYDILVTAQAGISAAETQFAGTTNQLTRTLINSAVTAYNAAEAAYISYHQAAAANLSPAIAPLQAQVATLQSAMTALATAK
jgi:hypothetical protein